MMRSLSFSSVGLDSVLDLLLAEVEAVYPLEEVVAEECLREVAGEEYPLGEEAAADRVEVEVREVRQW